MATLTKALAAIERHIGFPIGRTRNVARRLQDAGVLPLGAPGVAPAIDETNFADLFVAIVADTGLRKTPDTVATYSAMTPGGMDISETPERLQRNARLELEILIDLARQNPEDVRRLYIELVSNFPELAVHMPNGTVRQFQPIGSLPGHWQSTKHRTSTTVPGTAFVDAVRETFGGK